MGRRVLVAAAAAAVSLLAYGTGFSRWFALAAGGLVLVVADRLGLMPSPFEPSVRDMLHGHEPAGQNGTGGHVAVGGDPDESVLKALSDQGSDLTKAAHVRFYIYASTEESATRIGTKAGDATLSATVRPAALGPGEWLCLLQGYFVPTLPVLQEYRRRFTALALAEAGEYDGWEATITKQAG
jgi:hypothetical protein